MTTEKKTWEQLTKSERIIGIVGLCIAVSVGVGLVGSFVSALTRPHSSAASQTHQVATTYKDIQETESIPYSKETQEDSTRDVGVSVVTTSGVEGVRTKTYHVTYVDEKETNRVQTKDEITLNPITEVSSIGTHIPYVPPVAQVKSNCDSNYSGACVPIASDVDCGGGSGNGPAYVYSAVQVVGVDIYGLDRDGDGIGCE